MQIREFRPQNYDYFPSFSRDEIFNINKLYFCWYCDDDFFNLKFQEMDNSEV